MSPPTKRINVCRPFAPKRTTSYFSDGALSPLSIPGDPTGIPGTAKPMASGRVSSNRRTATAGTCPSRTYPLASAVWHAARSSGTPRRRRTRWSTVLSRTVTAKPAPWSVSPIRQRMICIILVRLRWHERLGAALRQPIGASLRSPLGRCPKPSSGSGPARRSYSAARSGANVAAWRGGIWARAVEKRE